MKKKYNILVTGVGAIIGYGIIESLKLANINCKIIGIDIFTDNYGKFICDKFIQVPYTDSTDYPIIIDNIIFDNSIDLIFPGIEQDLYYFNKNRDKFQTKIVLNQYELITLSKDKLEMYNYLNKQSFEYLIPTYTNLNFEQAAKKFGLPFIIKPKSSYASKGFHLIIDEEKYNNISSEINENTLFQPLVGSIDNEYTISVFGDGKGGFIDSLILRRYLSPAGASEKAFTIKEDKYLMKAVFDLVKIFNPIGPTNFQFRKNKNKVYLLEINPRISSACSIRAKFGYNDPLLCIQLFLEGQQYAIQKKLNGFAIRYIADKIEYE